MKGRYQTSILIEVRINIGKTYQEIGLYKEFILALNGIIIKNGSQIPSPWCNPSFQKEIAIEALKLQYRNFRATQQSPAN